MARANGKRGGGRGVNESLPPITLEKLAVMLSNNQIIKMTIF